MSCKSAINVLEKNEVWMLLVLYEENAIANWQRLRAVEIEFFETFLWYKNDWSCKERIRNLCGVANCLDESRGENA